MAVGKEAPIPDICAVAVAACKALEATVSEFEETLAQVPVTTAKRRLRDSEIVLPFANIEAHAAVAAAAPTEGLEKKL